MTRAFRFGHTAFSKMSSRHEWVDVARRAEACGYAVLTVTDHFGSSGGVWSALAMAHEAAPSLRVGTLMINNDLWNPAVLAREAITTDVLTDGSLELGIGAGWNEEDYRSAGVRHEEPARRIARLAEAVAIVRQATSGQEVAFHGSHYDVAADRVWPKPCQLPLPLVLGGGGRRVLQLAARNATTVSIHRVLEKGGGPVSWRTRTGRPAPQTDQVSERIGWIREAAGPRFASLELHALILRAVVTDRRESVAAELARPLGLEGEDVLASPHFLVGTADRMAADLVERRERWGISYWTITQSLDMEPFAPVVARLAGT